MRVKKSAFPSEIVQKKNKNATDEKTFAGAKNKKRNDLSTCVKTTHTEAVVLKIPTGSRKRKPGSSKQPSLKL